MKTPRSARRLPITATAACALLLGGGCADDPSSELAGPERATSLDARGAQCLAKKSLATRLKFATVAEGKKRLQRPDDWARQLSAFERSARLATLEPTSRNELLRHVSEQALDWTAPEEAYWQGLVDRLSAAAAGLNIKIPHVRLVKTTGLDEFRAVYARNDAIMIPQGRVDISGDETRDLFLLAHEFWHVLSLDDHRLRRAMFELLGFERFRGFEPPAELEGRRLSNPGGHTYEDALALQVTPDGPADVVPFIRSAASLEDIIALPMSGPPAIFQVLDIVLIPVDTGTGDIVRGPGGALVTYGFGNTDWVPQMARNSNFIIHPEEVIADNFASLMLWRDSGEAEPPGPVNDPGLLRDMEDVMTEGCGG